MTMPCRRFVCATLAAALVALVPSAVLAQTKPAPSANPGASPADEKAIATEEYNAGSSLASRGRWQEAYPLFLRAWGRVKHWQIAASLAKVELELGKYHAAEKHLSFALGAEDLSAVDIGNFTKLLERARAKQGTLRIQATAQAPARVFVDDELLGTTPFTGTTSADPGEHRVEVRFGGKRASQTVTVATAATQEVSLDLRVPELDKPIPPPEAPGAGPSWAGVIALGGVAFAGIAVGTGLWMAADWKGSYAQKLFDALPALDKGPCTTADCKAIHGALADQASLQTGAAVTWVLSGVAAAGAVAVWFFTGPRSAQKTAVQVIPVAGPQWHGLMVRGSF